MAEPLGPQLPVLARRAIAAHLGAGSGPSLPHLGGAPAGVFVTLRTADGALRGCIGSIAPSQPSLAEETARSAILAATRDPRFPPVRVDELAGLTVEVSALAPATRVKAHTELDPSRFGVIIEDASGRRALLLPGIEGIDDVETQLAVVRRKAGIPAGEPVTLSRFVVDKWVDRPEGT